MADFPQDPNDALFYDDKEIMEAAHRAAGKLKVVILGAGKLSKNIRVDLAVVIDGCLTRLENAIKEEHARREELRRTPRRRS